MPSHTALPRVAALLGLALLPGCATIISTPSQDVAVQTQPPGASCTFLREGVPVGTVSPTPGTARIGRSSRETAVACTREGYQPAQVAVPQQFNPWFLGNILLGGVIGVVVDASTAAIIRYPESVSVAMAPNPAPPPPPPVVSEPYPEPAPAAPRRAGRRQPGA